jgi:hypothetical protein
MINDYQEIRNAEGMPKLIDENMSLMFLLNAKNAVRNLAIGLSETATPEVRKTLRDQLNKAIDRHIAALRQKELIVQFLRRAATIQHRRLQYWIFNKGLLNAWGIDVAPCFLLKQLVSADMVSVGMGIEYHLKRPAVGLQNLQSFLSGFLIIAAVDEAGIPAVYYINAHSGGTVDIVRMFSCPYQFIHEFTSSFIRRPQRITRRAFFICIQRNYCT